MCSCCAPLVRRGSGAVQLTGRVRFCAGDGCFSGRKIVPERPRSRKTNRSPKARPFVPEKQAEYCLAGGWKVTAGLLRLILKKKYKSFIKKT